MPSTEECIEACIDRFLLRRGARAAGMDCRDCKDSSDSSNDYKACNLDDIAASVVDALALPFSVEADVIRTIGTRISCIEHDKTVLERLQSDRGITQRTPEWYAARADMITASDAAQALDCAKFGNQRQFFAKKCGFEADKFNPTLPALKWGIIYEPVACSVYSARMRCSIHDFGLLRHPTHKFLGASPDGINDLGVMVEIKCPYRRKINGEVPLQYYYQIQGQLDVCGLHSCDYVECELREYGGWEELIADSHAGHGRTTKDGCEHGFLYEMDPSSPLESSVPTCHYSELNRTAAELREDLQAFLALGPGRLHLFRVVKVGILRVKRDDAFLSVIVPQLEDVHARVQAFKSDRASYDAYMREKVTTTKTRSSASAKTAVDLQLPSYAFVDDNED